MKTPAGISSVTQKNMTGIKEVCMMISEAQKRAQKRFDEKNAVYVSLKLNRNTDADLIDILERVENKQGLIKAALRAWGKNGNK